jgi:hypothetical protein
MVVTPIGVLASVQVLPETGYLGPPMTDSLGSVDNAANDPSQGEGRLAFASELLLALGIAVIMSILVARIIRKSEARR